MTDLHFGYAPNQYVCRCGRHHGCGEITPEDRAARAARMRDAMPSLMPEAMRLFLADWERHHGRALYDMIPFGKKTGEFNKASKDEDLRVAMLRAA